MQSVIFIVQFIIICIILYSFIGYKLNHSKLYQILLTPTIIIIVPISYYLLRNNNSLPIFIMGILLIYIIFLFKGNLLKKCAITLICTAIISLLERLLLYLEHILLNTNSSPLGYYTHQTLIADLIILTLCILFTYKKKNTHLLFDAKYIVFITIYLFLAIILLEFSYRIFISVNNTHKNHYFIIFNLTWIFLITYFIIFIKNIEKNQKLKILVELNKAKENYYQKISEKNHAFASLRHDFLNHLKVTEALLLKNKTEEALAYIHDITNATLNTRNPIDVGNIILNAIITDCIECHKDENIEFQCSGMFPEEFYLPNIDLCTIFANVINNAFEANHSDLPSKYVYLKINVIENQIIVIIKNPIETKVNFQTSKKDKSEHGLGILNVQNTLQKYGGQLRYKASEHEMNTIVIFTDITNQQKGQ